MSADVLRRAAALMRERAEAATPSPWDLLITMAAAEPFVVQRERPWPVGIVAEPSHAPDDYGKGNGGHIASWHPAVALAVADWLDYTALYASDKPRRQTEAMRRALAVARAYLGET